MEKRTKSRLEKFLVGLEILLPLVQKIMSVVEVAPPGGKLEWVQIPSPMLGICYPIAR